MPFVFSSQSFGKDSGPAQPRTDQGAQSSNRLWPRRGSPLSVVVLAGLLAVLASFGSAVQAADGVDSAGYRSPGDRHKISVSNPTLVETLRAQGGRVIGDYGGFVLMEADSAVANGLAKSRDAQVVDENNLLLLNAGAIDTTTPAAQSLRAAKSALPGKQMYLIQFAGPIRPEWHAALVATGVRIVTYIPSNAYLVYGDSQALQDLAADSSITQWNGAYTAAHRVDPAITAANKDGAALANLSVAGNEQFAIQMVEDAAENQITLALIDQFKLEPIVKQDRMLGYLNVWVALPRDVVISLIADRGDVVSIQPWIAPHKMDERQDIIITGNVAGSPAVPAAMDYLGYLTGHGFDVNTAADFAVNVSDSGIDNATTTPNHFALYKSGDPSNPANSRILYNRLQGTPNGGSTLQGCDGHGNENSHIIGGYVPTGTVGGVDFGAAPHADGAGFRWGLGLAPFVKIGSSVVFDPDTWTVPTYQNLESQAYRDAARISSNSWGSTTATYTTDSQHYDALVRDAQPDSVCSLPDCISVAGNQEYVIVFSAGNAGASAGTIGNPANAKNVITVGAAENVNPFGGADQCGIDDTGANNANDIISFSSRGPTADGRIKPDIMAPGTHVSAGVAQASIASPTGSGTGAGLGCFTGEGVCGGTGSVSPGNHFFPAGQQWYSASSGTSHSAPAIAGVAALIRQHFINQSLTPPSPAMTKGLMMNAARYMNGVGANDTLPSNSQGMGEIDLNNYFDVFATAHVFHDQLPAETFTASGQQWLMMGTVSDTAKPFRVTLVWTDKFGTTAAAPWVNNLDLEVTVGGNTYKGNVFSGAFSVAGGVADTKNNVESVFLPAGVSGSFLIKIKATNIAGDGVPNNAELLDQDFALVVYNATEVPTPVISAGGFAITAENFLPANNAPDPGETVTLMVDLSNVGTGNTTNLVATLLNSGGVTPVTTSQNYGVVVAGGPAVSQPFTFVANGVCGGSITATFNLQDGALDLGSVTHQFMLGTPGAPAAFFSEAFDGVTAPALPAGWTTAAIGAESAWVSSTTNANSAPNNAFAPDVSSVGNTELVTPTINVPAGGGQLTFKNLYNMESHSSNPTVGYDGMVLEISINGGAFTDITTGGNAFIAGGYNRTISASFSSPIAGRAAWSGLSGGTTAAPTYITSTIDLPAAAAGQPIQLKWRAASDSSAFAGGAAGVRIDDVVLTSPTYVCSVAPVNAAPTATSLGIAGTAQVGQVLTGSYVYGDADGDAQDTSGSGSSYRFVRSTDNSVATTVDNADAASGTTAGSDKAYTLLAADQGKYLFYCVTPRASAGTSPGSEACSSATAAVIAAPVNAAPTATSLGIGGTAQVGQVLTGSYVYGDGEGDLENTSVSGSSYRFVRSTDNSVATTVDNVDAATGTTAGVNKTYTLQAADFGQYLFYCVTPRASAGTSPGSEACSSATAAVIAAPVNAAPTATSLGIGGTAQVGQVLTGSYVYGDAESDPENTSVSGSSYRFVRSTDNSVATAGDNVDAATGTTAGVNKTYTLQAADFGQYLFYCVTPRASTGTSLGSEACSSATAAVTTVTSSYTAPSATGTGSITAAFAVNGGCTYTASQYIPLSGAQPSPPAGVSFPHGLFAFTVSSCTNGSTLNFTITYPLPLAAGTQYWKYGPSPLGHNCSDAPSCAAAHWYVLTSAVLVDAYTMTFSITDGGLGDDELPVPNGSIVDAGGPGVPQAVGPEITATAVPTLNDWLLILLGLLLLGSAGLWVRRKG